MLDFVFLISIILIDTGATINSKNRDFEATFGISTSFPDACVLSENQDELVSTMIELPGYFFDENQLLPYEFEVFSTSEKLATINRNGNLVLIVNGNGFSSSQYTEFAKFLAKNGFIVAVVERNFISLDTSIVFDSIEAIYNTLNVKTSLPIALIGHSAAGSVVNNVAINNFEEGYGFNIKALINMAPNAKFSGLINGFHTPAYLTMYGSRDEDMTGTGGNLPHEAFMMYDRVGTEGSTTCNHIPCIASEPYIDKTLVHIYGADHASMIINPNEGNYNESYLKSKDQFCIGRAYVNGFLRWKMRNETVFKGFLRGDWRPNSFKLIKTKKPDGYGLPEGADLRLAIQFSPQQKQVIENFEDNEFNIGFKSSDLELIKFESNNSLLHKQPIYYRHFTNSLMLAWLDSQSYHYVSFKVPTLFKDISNFSHFSIRIGQVHGDFIPQFENTYEDIDAWVGILDGENVLNWVQLQKSIQRTDRFSVMSTFKVYLKKFNTINIEDVREVYLAFGPGKPGSVLVDSLEWIRD